MGGTSRGGGGGGGVAKGKTQYSGKKQAINWQPDESQGVKVWKQPFDMRINYYEHTNYECLSWI